MDATAAQSELRMIRNARYGGRLVGILIPLYFFLQYARPMEQLTFLQPLRLPLILSIFGGIYFFRNQRLHRTLTMKLLLAFMAAEAARNFIGYMVFDDLVRNDAWAYFTWMDLLLQFLGLGFPLMLFFPSGVRLRGFFKIWLWVLVYLAAYSITHSGVGPGGFLGDENDMGLALVMLLSYPLTVLANRRLPMSGRIMYFGIVMLALAGIAATVSRGAFVALIALVVAVLVASNKRTVFLASSVAVCLLALPILSSSYIEEIESITHVSEGTAATRRHFWTLATRVWLDPSHVLIGVGMANTPYHLGDYEEAIDLGSGPSSAGRAVHSVYFQLLPELGIWGILVFGSLVYISFRANRRNVQFVRATAVELPAEIDVESAKVFFDEAELVRVLSKTASAGLIGVMAGGTFLSALYYPHLWLMFSLSATLETYANKLAAWREEFEEVV